MSEDAPYTDSKGRKQAALAKLLDAAFEDAQENGALSLDEFKQGMEDCRASIIARRLER